MYYLIKESLTPCAPADIAKGEAQYVAVLTADEWQQRRDSFDMLIDMEMETSLPQETKAVVNQDSLTGTLCVPDRTNIGGARSGFAFALDEKGIVLVDDSGYAADLLQKLYGIPAVIVDTDYGKLAAVKHGLRLMMKGNQ